MHFVKDKMQHCIIFFTELSVKKDLFYIDARARYAILKELIRESGYISSAGRADYRSLKTKEKTTNILFFSEIHPVRDSRIID